MNGVLRWSCLFLLISIPRVGATVPKSVIHGIVTDIHGVVIRKALKPRVLVRWDESGADVGLETNVGTSTDVLLETDSMGRFQADIPPGFYDVFVSAFGFSPTCRKIRVKPGQIADFDPKLDVSMLVSKELADKPF